MLVWMGFCCLLYWFVFIHCVVKSMVVDWFNLGRSGVVIVYGILFLCVVIR